MVGEVITGTRGLQGRIQLISFKNCTVTLGDAILFDPSWGIYDMAVGVEVVSAYSGPASVNSFEDVNKVSETKTHKIEYSESDLALYTLYQQVRDMREKENAKEEEIIKIFNQLKESFPNDWLLMLELYEISVQKRIFN